MTHKHCWFDIPLDDDGEIFSIEELLSRAESCLQKGEYVTCYSYLKRSEPSDLGKLALARFYLSIDLPELTQEERFRAAEELLLQIANIPEACLELSQLYLNSHRPLAALSWRLSSGKKLERAEIGFYKKKIHTMEISSLQQYPADVYCLGMELSELPESRECAVRILQLACEYGDGPYAGIAALRIADLVENLEEQNRYLRIAKAKGYPEVFEQRAQYTKTTII